MPISTFCSVSDFIFPRSTCLFSFRKYVDWSWENINRSQIYEYGNGTGAAQFPEKEYINGIFVAVHLPPLRFHCVGEDSGIESRTVATLAFRRTNYLAKSHPQFWLDLIHVRLNLIHHTRLYLIHWLKITSNFLLQSLVGGLLGKGLIYFKKLINKDGKRNALAQPCLEAVYFVKNIANHTKAFKHVRQQFCLFLQLCNVYLVNNKRPDCRIRWWSGTGSRN
jgi:hypothetical protein